MTTLYSQDTIEAIARASVVQHNNFVQNKADTDGYFHRSRSSVPSGDYRNPSSSALSVSAASATDLATSIALTNDIFHVLKAHCLDDVAHLVADTAVFSVLDGYSNATDLTSVQVVLNACKAQYNLHIVKTTCHLHADSSNSVSASNATDQSSANTLANQFKTNLNAHSGSAPAVGFIKVL